METTSQSLEQQSGRRDASDIKSILDDQSLTFAEKAISITNAETRGKKSKTKSMSGEIVVVDVDLAMAQDSTGPLAIRSLNEMGIDKLYNPSKVLLVIDHTFPAADEKVANLHALMRDFASRHNCLLVEGSISHQYILEYLASPGMIILGADSHTCQACVCVCIRNWNWKYRNCCCMGYRSIMVKGSRNHKDQFIWSF
ncbi:MAG: aconitase family protein [Nitrososphaeraceae archaeon]